MYLGVYTWSLPTLEGLFQGTSLGLSQVFYDLLEELVCSRG
jgi:hypothetical protein